MQKTCMITRDGNYICSAAARGASTNNLTPIEFTLFVCSTWLRSATMTNHSMVNMIFEILTLPPTLSIVFSTFYRRAMSKLNWLIELMKDWLSLIYNNRNRQKTYKWIFFLIFTQPYGIEKKSHFNDPKKKRNKIYNYKIIISSIIRLTISITIVTNEAKNVRKKKWKKEKSRRHSWKNSYNRINDKEFSGKIDDTNPLFLERRINSPRYRDRREGGEGGEEKDLETRSLAMLVGFAISHPTPTS